MAKQATRLSDFQIPRADGIASVSGLPAQLLPTPETSAQVEPPSSPAPVQVSPKPTDVVAREQTHEHEVFPMRIAPRPPAEPRQAMTVRLPVSMHERIRILMFTSRRSQQDIVEEALAGFFQANQT